MDQFFESILVDSVSPAKGDWILGSRGWARRLQKE